MPAVQPIPAGARLIWVSLPYATFGLAVEGGVVVAAPPIARWAVGRPEREVAGYYRRRGAEFRECPPVTRVVHCKREPYDVYIGRPGPWGNPYAIGRDGDRAGVIALYERHLLARPDLLARLPELRGRVLGCWCAPQACHGDVLARYADQAI
jgi:Domain of unknown function (DUF4326)